MEQVINFFKKIIFKIFLVKHYYTKHIILCTGNLFTFYKNDFFFLGIEDWPEKITKEENSFAQKLNFNLKFYKKVFF